MLALRNKYKDLNLIEKVIRAMFLLEMLKLSGCPFCFKGGSALMLILGESARRLSIDIDIQYIFFYIHLSPLKGKVREIGVCEGDVIINH